ncbi:MAG: glycosyltransferase [Eubacteriales bacterium]
MKLSIIVPVYNMVADGKLEYCLESLVGQTITDYEIIAVDDYSTDESLQLLREYEKRYPEKFRVIASPENRKQGGAKNLGIEVATGKWIGFIDSDDWITPNMYQRLIEKAEETGSDMVACDYQLVHTHSMKPGKVVANHKENQVGALNEEQYRSLVLDSGSLVVKIYLRNRLLEFCPKFPEHMFYEDNAVSNAYVLQATKFAYIPEPMYYYYQHEGSTVHTITRKRCEDRMAAARFMLKHGKEENYLDRYRQEIEYKYTLLFYLNTIFSYVVTSERRSLTFMRRMAREMRETFPDFRENPYYIQRTDPEWKKFVNLHMKSTVLFVVYYDLLRAYRRIRYGE